jgi:predicted nucleic acid-binding protein
VKVFIDSNIPMYVAGRDHPLREPARRFLARVRAGEVEGCTSTEVLQEILYRYAALKGLARRGCSAHSGPATRSTPPSC